MPYFYIDAEKKPIVVTPKKIKELIVKGVITTETIIGCTTPAGTLPKLTDAFVEHLLTDAFVEHLRQQQGDRSQASTVATPKPDFVGAPSKSSEQTVPVLPIIRENQNGEPVLPLNMTVDHIRNHSFTTHVSVTVYRMRVTEDCMEIQEDSSSKKPITVLRENARKQVKLRCQDMKVRGDDGRKVRLTYQKKDQSKYLKLARLEAWMDLDLVNDPKAANQRVVDYLKKWTCCMVRSSLKWVNLLFGAIFIFVIWKTGIVDDLLNNPIFEGSKFEELRNINIAIAYIVCIFINVTFLTFIRFGKMWIHHYIIMFYFTIGLLALPIILGLRDVPNEAFMEEIKDILAIVVGAMWGIYYSKKAMRDYKRLRPQVVESGN